MTTTTVENKQEVIGWQMYDWAWSAFSTTVSSALLGPYLLELAKESNGVDIAGLTIAPASFFPFAVSASALLQVFILPTVGAIADYTPHKKRLMMAMAYLGSALLLGLFMVTADTVVMGGLIFVLAGVSFGAASVVYNSFLPDIAPPQRRDRISSNGYAYGYLGGGLWLAINFVLISVMDDTGLAVRISLAGTGVWAMVFFAAFPQRLIRPRPAKRQRPEGKGWLLVGVTEPLSTLKEMLRHYPLTFRYLWAYLMFTDGILTVIAVASQFAADELNASSEVLLALILMIQIVAIPGALLFGRLAERIGAKKALIGNLAVWMVLVVYAFSALSTLSELWALGVVLALVLGGSQALSRSLYSQMIPEGREAEYFGFYEITARGTSWLGPAVFGIVNQVTGSQRLAILSLMVFFGVGLIGLVPVKVRQAMLDAGQDPTQVRI